MEIKKKIKESLGKLKIKKKIKENLELTVAVVAGVIATVVIGVTIGELLNTVLNLIGLKIPEGWMIGVGIIMAAACVSKLLSTIIKRVPWPEYWVVDRRGKLIVKEPGYRIIVLFFGYDKIINRIQKGRQYGIQLFSDVPEPWIDLAKGGEIALHDPRIWIIVNDPAAAVQLAVNFEEQLREMSENRVSGAINVLTYEGVMTLRTPKILLTKKKQKEAEVAKAKAKTMIVRKLDEVIRESKEIKDFVEKFGKVTGFTLDDFNFDDETTQTRRQRITTEMQVEIAGNRARATTNEMSAMPKTAAVLEKAGFPKELAQEIASERYQDHLVGEKGRLQKIIWPGGISIPNIAAQWEMGKTILQRPAEKRRRKERQELEERIKTAKW